MLEILQIAHEKYGSEIMATLEITADLTKKAG
jgi:cyanate lyase